MAHYCVSALLKANGDYEFYTGICILLPRPEERLILECHEISRQAVEYA